MVNVKPNTLLVVFLQLHCPKSTRWSNISYITVETNMTCWLTIPLGKFLICRRNSSSFFWWWCCLLLGEKSHSLESGRARGRWSCPCGTTEVDGVSKHFWHAKGSSCGWSCKGSHALELASQHKNRWMWCWFTSRLMRDGGVRTWRCRCYMHGLVAVDVPRQIHEHAHWVVYVRDL